MKIDPFVLDSFAHVYFLTSHGHNVFYVGVTTNLQRRILEHKKRNSVFTSRYRVNKLIYFEGFGRIEDAIARKKTLKKWKRSWSMALIQSGRIWPMKYFSPGSFTVLLSVIPQGFYAEIEGPGGIWRSTFTLPSQIGKKYHGVSAKERYYSSSRHLYPKNSYSFAK